MYSQGCNCYYGPLYGQGLAPDYLPECDQAASQRQPVNTVTLDTGTGTRSSSHNEPSHLASITLKVINLANKKDMKIFLLRRSCDREMPQKLREEIVKQYGDQVPHAKLKFGIFEDNRRYG